jgi:hypothetical protein
MAVIQWNALSTNLYGSFEALTILPDAGTMKETAGRLPVLYLLHDNGENALQFLRSRDLETLCNEKKAVICCPWISHSFGQDYRWGGTFGQFAAKEFPGICANMFAVDNAQAMIGGIGTGAYAAFFLAREYPGSFRKAIGFDGRYDMAELFRQVREGKGAEDLSLPMMEAAFGDPDSLPGSGKDLFAGGAPDGAVLGCSPDFAGAGETRRLAERWGIPVHTGTLAQVLASIL